MGRSHGDTEQGLSAQACQVVPDLATFAVDDGFTYVVPHGTEVVVGSRVRIRVSGRRRRGFVTAVFPRPEGRKLLPIEGVVGEQPSYSEDDLPWLRWCASHYVTPLSTILRRTVPPNNPKSASPRGGGAEARGAGGNTIVVGPAPHDDRVVARLSEKLAEDSSALVLAPSTEEVEHLAASLRGVFGRRVAVAHSDLSAAAQTRAWDTAASEPGTLLVGTREAALWPIATLGLVCIVEDSRRVMRSPSTPTLGVREVLSARCGRAGVPISFFSPLPSVETLAAGVRQTAPQGRWWPLIEVADRREEPPSGAAILDRTRTAIAGAHGRGGEVFILVPRRGDAAAFRCTTCGALRRCPSCGSAADAADTCRRCSVALAPCVECASDRFRPVGAGMGSVRDDLTRVVGDAVGLPGEGRPVTVGTERDLIGVRGMSLAVAVDFDGAALAPNYRAAEATLRLLVRLANTVERGRGNRCVVQTSDPDQPVMVALRSGNGTGFLESELAVRRRATFPPFGQLLALEVSASAGVDELDRAIRSGVGGAASVLGPAAVGERWRWLVQAPDLSPAKVALRGVIGSIRDSGGRVRVDVDPIDL